MAKQLNITEQEELFSTECKLINLKYEYQGYTGTEKWAVVSELSEKELFEKYRDVISRYTPCVLLSVEQGEVIAEAKRNDDKYEKRSSRTLDVYGYEDDITESFHKELITDFEGQFDLEEKARLEREAEQKRTCDISLFLNVHLSPKKRYRKIALHFSTYINYARIFLTRIVRTVYMTAGVIIYTLL